MAVTSISDLTAALNTPFAVNWFTQYVTETSAFYRSGILARDAQIQGLVDSTNGQGKGGYMQYMDEPNGDDEPLKEGTALTEDKVTGGKDQYVIHRRGKAWAAWDLAGFITGAGDVVRAVQTVLGNYQIRMRQKMLFRTLKGVFASNLAKNSGDLVYDITGMENGILDEFSILDASALLGDRRGALTAVAMNSAAAVKLSKVSQKSQTFRPADQNPNRLASFNGLSIIEDDAIPYNPSTGVAEIFLFGAGAVSEVPVNPPFPNPRFEMYREELKGKTGIIARDNYIMHPRGIKWTGGYDFTDSPSNELVEAATSWERVFSKKNIRIVKLIAKVKAVAGGDSSASSGSSASSASSASSGG